MVFDQDCSWSAAFDLEAMARTFCTSIFVCSSNERNQKRLHCLEELSAIRSDLFLTVGSNSQQRRHRRDAGPAAC